MIAVFVDKYALRKKDDLRRRRGHFVIHSFDFQLSQKRQGPARHVFGCNLQLSHSHLSLPFNILS